MGMSNECVLSGGKSEEWGAATDYEVHGSMQYVYE